jgi:hypothetical protein
MRLRDVLSICCSQVVPERGVLPMKKLGIFVGCVQPNRASEYQHNTHYSGRVYVCGNHTMF